MKFFIPFLLIFPLIGCTSKTTKPKKEETYNTLYQGNTVSIPIFKDTDISEYTKEYSQFIKDYIAAIKNDDSKKIKQLKKQSLELTEKAKVISQKLKSHTEIEKFNKWLATQNKKIEILKEQN